MSKIAITPNASGTGTINIVAPNTNTDRTLTIPDVTGNVVTTGDSGTVSAGMVSGVNTSALPAGSVIQTVVYQVGSGFTNSISVNITSGGQDLGGGTITPTSASNKILIFASNIMHNDTAGPYGYLRLTREINSSVTTLTTWGNATGYTYSTGSRHQFATSYYDIPATTQEITYRHRLDHLSGTIDNQWNYGATSLVLMEIAQ